MENNLILTKEKLYDRRVKNGFGIRSGLFYGDKNSQAEVTDPVKNSKGEIAESIITASGKRWNKSAEEAKLWNQIDDLRVRIKKAGKKLTNLNQFPDDYYDLIEAIRIDLTRRRIEEMDFTPEFTNEITNPNFSKSITITEFLEFAGVFEEIKGTGDNVPMLQQKTGAKDSVTVKLFGLGHARSLEDVLYNMDIFDMQKVNRAVTRAHTALRNNICFNPLIALSVAGGWNTSQLVPAVNQANATYDVNLYLTLRNALRTLYGLLDPQTNQEISAPRVTLLVRNNVIQWDVQRVINGQLERFGQPVENRSRLAIDEIWTYKGDAIKVSPKTTTYAGVPSNTAYLFVTGPDGSPNYTLTKRQLTQEVGRGDVLKLINEKRAWYCGQIEYREEFLGSSSSYMGTTLGDGYGFVVAIELPEHGDST